MEIGAPYDNLSHQDTHLYEEHDQDVILTHATILSHLFTTQFMAQQNYEYLDLSDTPSTVPTTFQSSSDHTSILGVLITQWQSSATIPSALALTTTLHYPNS